MKAILLPLLCGAALLTGCGTVAVVDHGPSYYRPGAVYYDSGRPYYYTSGVRYWGYPRGYSGARYSHVEVDRDVTNNYYVDRRRVVRHDDRVGYHHPQTNYHHGQTTTTTRKVYAQPHQAQYTVKKKKVKHDEDDRD